MMYFTTRKLARKLAVKSENFKVVDNGTDSVVGKRWAVKVL